jgi:hypothetical protein
MIMTVISEIRSSFKRDIVFAYRAENVHYLAIRDGATGMHGIGWNYADGPRLEQLRETIHDNFEFAFESVGNLFMRMGMLGENRAGHDVPIYECHPCRSDKLSTPPGKWGLHWEITEACIGHCGADPFSSMPDIPFPAKFYQFVQCERGRQGWTLTEREWREARCFQIFYPPKNESRLMGAFVKRCVINVSGG